MSRDTDMPELRRAVLIASSLSYAFAWIPLPIGGRYPSAGAREFDGLVVDAIACGLPLPAILLTIELFRRGCAPWRVTTPEWSSLPVDLSLILPLFLGSGADEDLVELGRLLTARALGSGALCGIAAHLLLRGRSTTTRLRRSDDPDPLS